MDMNPLGLKPDDIVYCTVTNSVLYARDALFDADWRPYRHEEFPAGEPFHVVPMGAASTDDGEAGVSVDTASEPVPDNEGGADASDNDAASTDDDEDDGSAPRRRHRGR